MTSERDELADVIGEAFVDNYGDRWNIAGAVLADGYRKTFTVTTAEELDGLPEESVVLDKEGDVSQKRGGWCGYEMASLSSKNLAKYGPFMVLHVGER